MTRFVSVFVVALCACDQPSLTPPAAPFGLQIPGGTLSAVHLVQVRGSAEAGLTIELFTDAACAGTAAVTGTAEEFGMTGLTVTGTAPRVRLDGTTEAGARVRVFTNATCAGTPADDATVRGAAFSLELAVPANTETSFTALAVDGPGNLSACSSPPLRFSHDSLPPAAPVLTALVPTGPSSNAQPSLSGTAEMGATASAPCT